MKAIIIALLLTSAVPLTKPDGAQCPAGFASEVHYLCADVGGHPDGHSKMRRLPERLNAIGRLLPADAPPLITATAQTKTSAAHSFFLLLGVAHDYMLYARRQSAERWGYQLASCRSRSA